MSEITYRIIRSAFGRVDSSAYSGYALNLDVLARETEAEVRKAIKDEEVIHLAHFHDRYPLCWGIEREGEFVADKDPNNVTCIKCFRILYITED